MSAAIDKKIQVLFYLILRSAPKQVVQNPPLFAEEVDSLGVG